MEKAWLSSYPAGVPASISMGDGDELIQLFSEACQQFADRPAFQNGSQQLSYRTLWQHSQNFAAYLHHDLGLKPGDKLALMMPNLLAYPVALFGALSAGLVVVNVNPLYTESELAGILTDAQPQAVVVMMAFYPKVQRLRAKLSLTQVIVTQIGDFFPAWKQRLMNGALRCRFGLFKPLSDAISFTKALARGQALPRVHVALTAESLAFLQYTGGTTGTPKAAMLTHGNMVANIRQIVSWVGPTLQRGQETVITALPLYHIFALTANCLSFLQLGALSVLITNPKNMPAFLKQLRQVPFSVLLGVNTLFAGLLKQAAFAKLDFSTLKISLGGGAPVLPAVAKAWQQVTGCVLLEGYGLTEASPVVTINPLTLTQYNGSIGLPVPGTDVRLVPLTTEEDTADASVGELCVKGPQVMLGYWQRPEETAASFTHDGYLRTGDMAKMDEQGFFFIVDRKKDLILVSGFNVYPSEVEAVLLAHPQVTQAAVVGVPCPETGEKVVAVVVAANAGLDVTALQKQCRQSLAGYKVPKAIHCWSELPLSPIGKVLKRELKAQLSAP